MKKILSLIAFACVLGSTQAQITLSSSSVGPIGSTYYVGVDTSLDVGYDIGMPGTNLTWDFTLLNQDYYDTIMYLDPANTPSGPDFPTANLSVSRSSDPSAYAYFDKSTTEFNLLGFAADPFQTTVPLIAQQNPPATSAVFPWTYMSTLADTSGFSIRIDGSFLGFPGVDSVEIVSESMTYTNCDSWGNLMLWGNSYSALRNRGITTTHDLVNARFFGSWTNFQDTTYTDSTFTWLNDTKGYTLAEAKFIGGVLDEIIYQDANPVGINRLIDRATLVYPNPTTSNVIIRNDLGSIHTVRVWDVSGKLIHTQPMNGTQTEINLAGIAPGLLLIQGLDENGAAVMSRKLVLR